MSIANNLAFAVAAMVALVLPADVSAADSHEAPLRGEALPVAGIMEPTLPSIQTNVFNPACAMSFCHGAAANANLDLREGASYANLVNVPSVEFPVWDRVTPLVPDESYLICKMEACPEMIGQQMPIIGGPLDQTIIDVIRQWIEDGAPEQGGVAVEPTSWGRIKAVYR